MTVSQRAVWAQVIVMPLILVAYFAVVLTRAADRPIEDVSWIVPMIWAMGSVIVGVIIGTIASAIGHGVRATRHGEDPDFEDGDIRDKEIEKIGNLKGMRFTSLGTVAVIVLAMLRVDHFWIANAMFLAGMLGGIRGGVAKLRAYREGF